jgi:hypothetical protein
MTFSLRPTLVATAVMAALALGACSASVSTGGLDIDKAEKGIAKGIKQQTGYTVTVKCPDDVDEKKGGTFICDSATADGQKRKVKVTQKDDDGHVVWKLQ